jgi:membrane-associated phospholipid phosphatase
MDAKPQSQGEKKTGKRKFPRWLLYSIFFFGICLMVLLRIDVPLSSYLKILKIPDRTDNLSKQVDGAMEFFKWFVQPFPLLLLVLATAISAGAARWRLIGHLLLGLALTTAFVWVGKLLVARQRPKWFQGTRWEKTFTGFLPGAHNFKEQSFPSGDAALAFAMGLILAYYFPKHRYILYLLATGCAFSRIYYQFHFLSDVICGALIGYLVARIVLYLGGASKAK